MLKAIKYPENTVIHSTFCVRIIDCYFILQVI